MATLVCNSQVNHLFFSDFRFSCHRPGPIAPPAVEPILGSASCEVAVRNLDVSWQRSAGACFATDVAISVWLGDLVVAEPSVAGRRLTSR